MFDRRVEIVARWRDLAHERWRRDEAGKAPMPHRVLDDHGRPLLATHSAGLAQILAAVPEDIAYLLGELEKLRRENDELRAASGKETIVGKSREGDITLATFKVHSEDDD